MSSPLLLHRVLFACLLFYYAAVLEARNKQQCDKYLEFEQQLSCGPSGYPIGYGFRYCHRFYDHYDEFTSNGQQYIDCTGKCLIDQLNRYINENSSVSCESVKKFAYGTHPDCYVKCGFCDIFPRNIRPFVRVLELKDLKLKEVVKTAAKCTGEYWDKLKEAVSDGAKVTINKLLEWARQLEPAAQGPPLP